MPDSQSSLTRRDAIAGLAAAPLMSATGSAAAGARVPTGFRPLFDGRTLTGWHKAPRVPPGRLLNEQQKALYDKVPIFVQAKAHPGHWTVEHGAIVSAQELPHVGGSLVTDEAFGDFELLIDVKPDWPCDTGIYLRTLPEGWRAWQVLVDHRPGGTIGGYYGNDLAGFHAVPYGLDVERDAQGRPVRLIEADPQTTSEPVTDAKRALLDYFAPIDTFLKTWKFGGWNRFRIRCVGHLPVITTWINGTLISEIDIGKVVWPGFDPVAIAQQIGPRGHIALELHDNYPGIDPLKDNRWGPGNEVRWRNIAIREVS